MDKLTIIKRIQRHAARKTHLEMTEVDLKDTNTFSRYELPFQSRSELSGKMQLLNINENKCDTCNAKNVQWWIFPTREVSESKQFKNPLLVKSFQVYTNSVKEGFKCNTCKEEFLRKYLQPNWFCDMEKQNPQLGTNWQPFGLLEILSL